jgi:uncharacterized membrane protein
MLDILLNPHAKKSGHKKIVKVSDRADKPIKSMMKAVSWRIVGTVDTMLISYLITGKISLAVTIGSMEVFTKTILYYFHERLWSHVHRLKLNLSTKSVRKQQYELDRIEQ